MLNVGLRVLIASSLVVTAVACGKSTNKKPSMGKRAGQEESSDWAKGAIGAASSCMKLDVLANLIRNLGNELVSVHTVELDFVTLQTTAGRPPTDAERKAGKIASTYYQFARIDNIPEILKANYFLRPGNYKPVAETYPGSQISVQSKQIAGLLSMMSQTACTLVTFEGAQAAEVLESSPRAIKVRVGDEYRTYQMFGRDQVMISVIKPAGAIPACDGSHLVNDRTLVRRSYLLSKSSSRDRYQVSKPLASIYYGFVFETPELLGRPDRKKGPAQQKPDDRRRNQRHPPQERTDYAALSGTSLDFIARVLDKEKGLPGLTCATAPKAKPQQ